MKLYARVEDNDPAGPKGFESSVVVVHVISREDMQRMTLAREGLEVLQSKYEQARRRLEALDKQIEDLQKQLAKAEKEDPQGEVAKEVRRQDPAARRRRGRRRPGGGEDGGRGPAVRHRQGAEEAPGRGGQDLEQSAREAEELSKKAGLSSAGAKKGLEDVRDKLGMRRQQFQKQAADPIEFLAKIFPLKEDEARFVELYQRQRDLAERMKSLADLPANDPRAKIRMRDLEAEQRQLHDDLAQLLVDIDNHVAALPADKKLDELRKTAKAFADAVRKSEASDQMSKAESALSEFAGSPAALRAKEAADTLEEVHLPVPAGHGRAGERGAELPTRSSPPDWATP